MSYAFWNQLVCLIVSHQILWTGENLSAIHHLGTRASAILKKTFLKNYLFIYSFTFGYTGVLLLLVGATVCCRAWVLGVWVSLFVAHGLLFLHRMWDLPRPGMETVSPALAGRFLIIRTKKKILLNNIKQNHKTSYLRIIFHINFILALIFISKDGKTIVKQAATLLAYWLKHLHCFAKWK